MKKRKRLQRIQGLLQPELQEENVKLKRIQLSTNAYQKTFRQEATIQKYAD